MITGLEQRPSAVYQSHPAALDPGIRWQPAFRAPLAEPLRWPRFAPPETPELPAPASPIAPMAVGLRPPPDRNPPQIAIPPAPRRRLRLPASTAVLVAVLVAASVASLQLTGFITRPQPPAPPALPVAMTAAFHRPIMVLRAAQAGAVASIAVRPGDEVTPSTVLMTLQTSAPADPAQAALHDRLIAAQRRLAALDPAFSVAAAPGEAARLHALDLRRQGDLAAAELAAAQEAVARQKPLPPISQPVLAGLHGLVASVEVHAGDNVAIGSPLVRLADCDHGFFTTDATGLHEHESVDIKLADFPLLPVTVRAPEGPIEPSSGLVLQPPPGAFAAACPKDAAGTILPPRAG